ncbi:MAG: alpha/beta hydrolase [Bacteroidota bacterium]
MAHIFFAHANGFPAGTYTKLFQHLAPHSVASHPALGVGDYRVKTNWKPLVQELIEVISQHQASPMVGLGHSLGAAVMLMAAQERPGLFSRLILMDPPFLGRKYRALIRIMRVFGPGLLKHAFPLSRGALGRRQHFSDPAEAATYWGSKAFFASFDPDCLQAYVAHGLAHRDGGLTLSIPAAIEAQIFATIPSRLPELGEELRVDYVYALGRGAVLRGNDWREFKAKYPAFHFHPREGGHMFPLEEPMNTAQFIKSLLDG